MVGTSSAWLLICIFLFLCAFPHPCDFPGEPLRPCRDRPLCLSADKGGPKLRRWCENYLNFSAYLSFTCRLINVLSPLPFIASLFMISIFEMPVVLLV